MRNTISTITNGKKNIKPRYIGPRRLGEATRREINYTSGFSPVEMVIELSKKAVNSKI